MLKICKSIIYFIGWIASFTCNAQQQVTMSNHNKIPKQVLISRLLKMYGPLTSCKIAEHLGILGNGSIYWHLHKLESAGLIKRNRSPLSAAQVTWSLVDEGDERKDRPIEMARIEAELSWRVNFLEQQRIARIKASLRKEHQTSISIMPDTTQQDIPDSNQTVSSDDTPIYRQKLSEIQRAILAILALNHNITIHAIRSHLPLESHHHVSNNLQVLRKRGLVKTTTLEKDALNYNIYRWSLVSPEDAAQAIQDIESEPRKKQKLDQQASHPVLEPLDINSVIPLPSLPSPVTSVGVPQTFEWPADVATVIPLPSPITFVPAPLQSPLQSFNWPTDFFETEAHTDA